MCEQIIFIHRLKLFSTLKKLTFSISPGHTATCKSPVSYSLPYSLPSLWKIFKRLSPNSPFWSGNVATHHFDQATWQHPRESHRHVRGSARTCDVRMAQFVLKIEKLSHIMGARILRFMVSIPNYGSWLKMNARNVWEMKMCHSVSSIIVSTDYYVFNR